MYMGEQQVREKGQEPAARNVRAQFSSLEASLESSLWRAALRQSERATCVEAGGENMEPSPSCRPSPDM